MTASPLDDTDPALPTRASGARSGAAMRYTIERVDKFLRADLYHRKTAEETRTFLHAVAAEALRSGIDRVMVSVHASAPLFRVQAYGLSEFLEIIAARQAHRIALVADSFEGQLAQQYVVILARFRKLNVRTFAAEAPAIAWLRE